MTKDEAIKAAAGKFCGWKIPTDFYPDCYISIDRDKAFAHPHNGPTGTNLFAHEQAQKMFNDCIGEALDSAIAAARVQENERCARTLEAIGCQGYADALRALLGKEQS